MKFPSRSRLLSQAQFRFVFTSPVVSADPFFRVLSRSNELGYCRLGMAVSRKVCKRATGRNQLKRIVRESFRIHQESLAHRGGHDIVVLPSSRAATICNKTLFESLQGHWRNIEQQ